MLALLAPATLRAQCTPPAAGLVGWWKGDGTAMDVVAANNGVLVNIGYTNGVVGQAFACDPENQPYTYSGVQIADQPAYALTNSLTIEGWVRPRGDGYVIFWRGDNRPGLDPYYISMSANNTLVFSICDASGNSAPLTTTLNYFAWTHVAATLDGSSGTMSIYTNGVLAVQTNTTIRPFANLTGNSPGIGIGNVNDGGNNFPFYGDIDEISLYNRALAANEIQAIYNAGSMGKCVPTIYDCVAPPAGLVSWWQGEGNAHDLIGNNNGTLAGNAGYTNGKVGQAFVSDGIGDCVTVGNPTNLQLQNFTIETWVKRSSSSIVSYGGFGNGIIFGYGQGGYGLYVDANGTPALSAIGISQTKPSVSISDTNFHHLAVTKAGSTVIFYIDGIAYSAPAYDPGFVFTTVAAIGARGDNLDNSFFGSIDEVSFYDRALSSNEITAIYTAGSGGKCTSSCTPPPSGITAWWTAEGNALDQAGMNNGSLIDPATYSSGEVGQAFSLNGAGSYVQISNSPSLNPGGAFSIEGWIYPTRDAEQKILSKWGDQGAYAENRSYALKTTPGLGLGFTISDLANQGNTSFQEFTVNGVLILNTWNHVAATYDSVTGIRCLYVNGMIVGSLTNAPVPVFSSITPVTIGSFLRGPGSVQDYFQGLIDELSFYSRNLSGNEIQAIYNAGNAGKCTANIPTPPVIYSQPTNQAVLTNNTATFTVVAGGATPLSYQWCFNSIPLTNNRHIAGSTTASLNISNTLPADAGNYTVVITNSLGSITSSIARLAIVTIPTAITLQPQSQTVIVGGNVIFTAAAIGDAPLNYQWYFNGNPLADNARVVGSTSTNLSLSNVQTSDAGNYTFTVTNLVSSMTSTTAVLTVLVPATITTQPVGRSVPPGLPTTFTAAAAGTPVNLQWQLNGTDIPGATGSSYTIAAVGTNDLGFYRLVASNSLNVAMSAEAQLTFGSVAAWGRNLSGECLPPPGLTNVFAVAGTYGASFAMRTDGSITAWGSGIATNIPVSASNVVAMAAYGGVLNYALRSDGRVVSWGGIIAPPVSNVVSIAAGNGFAYALRAEGILTNWGSVPWGSNPALDFPAGLNHLTGIAAGYNNAIAVKSDGTIVVAGIGAVTNVPAGLTNVMSVAVGYTYAMALKADGKVLAWGAGTVTNLPSGMTNIVAISAGNYPNQNLGLAIRSDGKVLVWGDNGFGETNAPAALTNLISIAGAAAAYHGLALVNDSSPVILSQPIGLTAFTGRDVTLKGSAAGASPLSYQWLFNGLNIPGATNASLFLSNVQPGNVGNYQLFVSNSVNTALSLPAPLTLVSNNVLTILGVPVAQTNYQGGRAVLSATVLGNGPLRYQWYFSPTNQGYSTVPGATNDTLVLEPALAINTGNYYLAVSNQFAGITSTPVFLRVLFARAWGYQALANPPVNVTNAISLAVGYNNPNNPGTYFALGANGKLTVWAAASFSGETNIAPLSNSFVTAIASGQQHDLALKSDGTVYAWGNGVYGQTNPPSGLNNVTGIACGAYHDLALKSDGTVVGWGVNPSFNYGQSTNFAAATNVVAIAAAQYRSMALRADGTVVSWGFTGDGTAVIPFNATNVIAITGGVAFNAALRADGKVVQWGSGMNAYPVPSNLSNVVAISGSSQHCTALKNDGTVVSWGVITQTPGLNNFPADLANVIAIASNSEQDMALFGNRAPAFTVQPWNRAIPVNATTNIFLAAKCAGVQPVFYQWQLNGTNVPNATNDVLILTNRISAPQVPNIRIPTGAYQLIASNAYGVTVSKYSKVNTFIPLGDALDTLDSKSGAALYNWTTTGNAQWFGETNITHDGVDAAQSGGIGLLQESILQTTVSTNWSGRYTFWWKVSSEEDFDFLEFRLNGNTQAYISGETGWQQTSIPVATGTNVLQWRYSKDVSFDSGLDAGWVDQFAFIPDPPLITTQPVSQTVNAGSNITFRVNALGPNGSTLGYQWRQNGNLVGANSSVLTLNNVRRVHNGIYSVTVTNLSLTNNFVISSNAVLKVLVPQLLGTPVILPDGSFQLISKDANGGALKPADLANFEAQTSTNLLDWMTLPDVLSFTNGTLLLQDNGQTNYPTRFYRLLEH
ncbi:MAG: LamG-like jellyroll fold domain-containing protein [Limisphaerales bacterium]